MQAANSLGEAIADLNEAAMLVNRALGDMNHTRMECTCCGLQVQENFEEYQIHQQLTAVVRKLNTLAKRLTKT